MIKLKNVTLRNFLSVGAVTQAVKLDNKELTLILGENLDMGGNGARNGVGKTVLLQSISYALFGYPINNIRKDNLINHTNTKNMLVTLEFSVNGVDYKIERGRKPNVLKFYVNNDLQETKDDAQGENKETQIAIERAIEMTHDMFKHIVALNTYSQPFLAMSAGDQRKIIEQLLGITLLSEKADIIKEKIRINKEQIQLEDVKNKAIEEANKRIKEQIDSLKRRQNLWVKQHDEAVNKLVDDYECLSKIDIDRELITHKELAVYNEKKKKQDTCNALIARQTAWLEKREREINELKNTYDNLAHIDIEKELQAHKDLAQFKIKKLELDTIKKTITHLETQLKRNATTVEKLTKEVETLQDNKCYACGQDFHDANHTEVLSKKKLALSEASEEIAQTQNDLEKNKNSQFDLGTEPKTYYNTESEAIKHNSDLESLLEKINMLKNESDPYRDQIDEECTSEELGTKPETYYDTEQEAIEHKSIVANLVKQIETKNNEQDPYKDQISDMENQALQSISFDRINELSKMGEHYKFLLDLFTSKDSFVRKKIIDQNLHYLNARLTHYLDKIGLPHTVVFKNDLSVEITDLGRELDFYNLSRGEMNRLILSLSFAFRDVWENLYFPINTMFIDELLDNGTDTIGLENSLAILKDMSRNRGKSIWLVSHKDELQNRVGNVLKVIKEGGFTTYESESNEGS